MRVVIDTAVLRRPHTGIATWLNGLLVGFRAIDDIEVIEAAGPPRMGNGLPFRPLNLATQRWWYEVGLPSLAARRGAAAILATANYAARRSRIPQLVTLHDVNPLTRAGTYEAAFARYAEWTYRRAAKDAERIMTVSEFSRQQIIRHLGVDPSRISVVYPGLEAPPESAARRPVDAEYALYVGATEQHKNVQVLLDAWKLLPERFPILVIVGQPGRAHAELAARAATARGRVVLVGRVSPPELEAWYRHALLFLFPSLAEGFGYPPLEAMQRSVPVVAARAGSLPEILGDAAVYHHPTDAAEVALRVRQLVDDTRLRRDLVARGLERARRYEWTRSARDTFDLLTTLS